MKELKNLELNTIVGGTCYSAPVFMVLDHFTGVCIGIKVH